MLSLTDLENNSANAQRIKTKPPCRYLSSYSMNSLTVSKLQIAFIHLTLVELLESPAVERPTAPLLNWFSLAIAFFFFWNITSRSTLMDCMSASYALMINRMYAIYKTHDW